MYKVSDPTGQYALKVEGVSEQIQACPTVLSLLSLVSLSLVSLSRLSSLSL